MPRLFWLNITQKNLLAGSFLSWVEKVMFFRLKIPKLCLILLENHLENWQQNILEIYTNTMQYEQNLNYFRHYQYSPDYYKHGGYICPSDVYYGRPKRAVNTYGVWKVNTNLLDFQINSDMHTKICFLVAKLLYKSKCPSVCQIQGET